MMLMYMFLGLMVLFSLFVLWSSSTMLCLFSLLFVYLLLGFLFISIGLHYLGSLLLIMYVSAVGILFIFFIMLISDKSSIYKVSPVWSVILSLLVILTLYLLTELNMGLDQIILLIEDLSMLDCIGRILYTSYLFEVLIVGLLCLLVVSSLYLEYKDKSLF